MSNGRQISVFGEPSIQISLAAIQVYSSTNSEEGSSFFISLHCKEVFTYTRICHGYTESPSLATTICFDLHPGGSRILIKVTGEQQMLQCQGRDCGLHGYRRLVYPEDNIAVNTESERAETDMGNNSLLHDVWAYF